VAWLNTSGFGEKALEISECFQYSLLFYLGKSSLIGFAES
jgi:hypothetical protein